MPEKQIEQFQSTGIWNQFSKALWERLGRKSITEEAKIKSTFRTLTEPSQKLLISMAHHSPEVGGKIDAIEATSGLPDEKLETAMGELQGRGLIERGKLLHEDNENRFRVTGFQQNSGGNYFRLPENIQTAVLKDIVGLKRGPWFP